MNIPGFVPASQRHPFYFRAFIYGEPKAGKSVFCGSWPSPLLIHPCSESGYDTFLLPDGSNLFPHIRLGEEHHLWLQSKRDERTAYRRVSEELRDILRLLSIQLDKGECPYKTIVIGGFNVLQEMVRSEGEAMFPGDSQKVWGTVLSWAQKLIQSIYSFPAHVIIECGANIIDKDKKTAQAVKWAPAVAGKAYNEVLSAANLVIFQYKGIGRFYSSVAPSDRYVAGSRLVAISYQEPLENACYDTFAQPIGLPPIRVVDPSHPRVRGMWPWNHVSY